MTPKGPHPAAGATAPVKLTPTSYLVLGMIRLGVSSGYAIKKAADQSTQNFWPISLALVYPELARLEAGGLVSRRSDPRGERARSAYAITDAGEAALGAWLRSAKVAQVQIRDEAMLKLFFADALDDDGQRALFGALRERNRARRQALEEEVLPSAQAFEVRGIRCVAAAARLSAGLLEYAEDWLGQMEARLAKPGAKPAAGD
jgi:DNA-binding PadR family transcriptional regulator